AALAVPRSHGRGGRGRHMAAAGAGGAGAGGLSALEAALHAAADCQAFLLSGPILAALVLCAAAAPLGRARDHFLRELVGNLLISAARKRHGADFAQPIPIVEAMAGVVVARRGLHRGGLAGGGAPRQPRRFAGGAGAGHGGLPRVSVPVRRPGGRGPSGVALLWHHRRPAGPEAAGGPQLRPGSAAAGAGCPVRSLCRLLAEPGRPVAEPRREAGAAEEVLPPQGGAHRRGHPRDAPGPRGSWAPPDSLEHYACYWGASLGGALAAACVFAHGTGRPLFGAAPRAAGAACAERKPKQL
ncbi:unnamed protein product, partial [Prorocentrum cordatum]